jgi:hypothetical protein
MADKSKRYSCGLCDVFDDRPEVARAIARTDLRARVWKHVKLNVIR